MAFKKIKKIIIASLLAGALYLSSCSANKGWTKFHALYDCKDRHAIYKLEGTAKCEKTGTDFWGFGQTKASRKNPNIER